MTPTALALTLLLAGPAPLTISGDGFAIAPVTVNEQGPYLLVVDTAAGASTMYPRLVEELGIDPEGGTRVSVQGASGIRRVPMHRIGPLEVAGVSRPSLSAVVLDAGHLLEADEGKVFGILGADFLSHFDVVMDFAAGEMSLTDPADNAPANAEPFHPLYGRFLLIPARVDGVELTAVVDTGARRSLMNAPVAEALGLEPGDERLVKDQPVRGATTDETEAWTYRAKKLRAGGAKWKQPEIGVSDLPVFAALGLDEKPAMIFGVNLLVGRSLRIDYDEKRLLIGAPASPSR